MVYIAVIAFKQGGDHAFHLAMTQSGKIFVQLGTLQDLAASAGIKMRYASCRPFDQCWHGTTGHPARLSYGIDSSGNTCGQKNAWNGGSGPDLTEYKNLYYLNPLELLDTNTFLGARSVCVKECPGTESACSISSLPCRSNVQYRCTRYPA